MIKEYIFISYTTSSCNIDTTAIKIVATDEKQALSKAYNYFGGDNRLKVEEFNVLCHNTSINRIYEIFKDFTGQNISYFGLVGENNFVDRLETVDIIKCQ